MERVIEISHLYKSFGEIKAVDDLSFSVRRGEMFAFLGENGAGKSTTISIICGQLRKDSGEVYVCSEDISNSLHSIKRKIGVVFQNSVLDGCLTVRDNLEGRAALYGINKSDFETRLDELSKLLDFEDILDRTVAKLSGGQRRRIDIARALLHSPEVLILDEPTTGLDPQTRRLLWSVIDDLRRSSGLTVFLTTHYMEEAAEADYIVILDSGKLVAEGTPHELKNIYTGDFIMLYGVGADQVAKLCKPYTQIRGGYRVSVSNTAEAAQLLVAYPEMFNDFEITKGKMDDVFLAVTGKKLEGGDRQ